MTRPNTTPAGSGQDGHLGELTATAAIALLLLHADDGLTLEDRAADVAARPARVAARDLTRWATREWVIRFGSLQAVPDPMQWSVLAQDTIRELRGDVPDPAAELHRYAVRALALGTRQAGIALDLPAGVAPAPLSESTVRAVAATTAAVAARYDTTERLLTVLPIQSHDDLMTALAPTHGAARDVDRDARTLVNTAINQGAQQVAAAHSADLLWFSERDACFIASTRVLAPSVLADGPGGPSRHVTAGPLHGLPSDPTSLDVSLGGNPSLLATSAVARPIRDRFGEVHAVSSREYVGDVVRIRTASGKDLTGTPNHPIATRGGWVPLGQLKVGDHVFSRTNRERVPMGVDPDDDSAPPTIEQVAQAFPVPVRVVPTASEDFHGDGAGSDVHVVWTDRLLLGDRDASSAEHVGQLSLQRGYVRLSQFAGAGLRLLGRVRALAARVGLGCSSDDRPTPFRAELMGTAEVLPDDQSVALEPTSHRDHVDAVDHGYFLGRLAGLVEPDEIVEVGRREFRGQVLNLETVEGWYLAEDIAVHNCVVCLALSGMVVGHAEDFDPFATFGKSPTAWWTPPGATQLLPPRHPRCRCRIEAYYGHAGPPGSLTLPDALKREAQRSIARGWSLPSESEQVRVDAAARLLARGSDLPKTVQAVARDAIRAGRFTTRDVPQTSGR